LPRAWREPALRLGILLRLAVLLNRSRNQAEIPPVELSVDARKLAVIFDPDWLKANPLTVADLEREQRLLAQAGYELSYS
jgi:exopolyphosphatase/guanosine-5'-triphosphate,3'-diphosphate pyrophosphatase